MNDTKWLSRTELLIGTEKLNKLNNAHVLVVGMGGVGSFAAEFICRAGVGEMTIIDGDIVDPSNRNRQLPALATTHGQSKVLLMADRLMQINPELKLNIINEFVMPERVEAMLAGKPHYIAEAIDSIMPKITFIQAAYNSGLKIVSSMGAGGRMDPTKLHVSDISKSYNCPFAQQVRKQLKSFGIKSGIKVVFSSEMPDRNSLILTDGTNFKKSAYGTISYLPAALGGTLASVVIRDLMQQ
jgi:tRNA A37 threonylcarbamoyladenosine dehydratase